MRFTFRSLITSLLLFAAYSGWAQQLYLQVSGENDKQTAFIDSIGYAKAHVNAKSVSDQVNALEGKLKTIGFLSAEITKNQKLNDSTFAYFFNLGPKTDFIHIYIGKDQEIKRLAFADVKHDTIILAVQETEAFMNRTLSALERKGYSLARLRLSNLIQDKNILRADLENNIGNKRQVNDIVINGYDKFPEGHKKQVRRMFRNTTFNQDNLKKIHHEFAKFRFVTQPKYPEILFSKDTTNIYVYLEKAKANRFDGFIGFSNDESEGNSKVRFNGYLDLLLVNALNTGEQFTLFWKSDGKEQKTFNVGLELPYIFKSPFGLKANLNIFKKDSTFQNTKTAIALGYFIRYNTRVYLGYESTESSDIQNTNTASISDFKNSFATSSFEYSRFSPDEFLFPEKTRVLIRAGVGSRKTKFDTNSQALLQIDLMHNLNLNEKNSINLKSQNYYLDSDTYIVSELYRFGGINSVRGFNENSLQANLITSLLTEYRYVFAPGLYVHSIIDYGYYTDKSRNSNNDSGNLLGLGFGFGLLTKNGLFNIVYANGTANDQQIKLANSIVHISFRATF